MHFRELGEIEKGVIVFVIDQQEQEEEQEHKVEELGLILRREMKESGAEKEKFEQDEGTE